MFYLKLENDVERAKTAVSAADALRQHAEWEARGVAVIVTDVEGTVMTLDQLRDDDHA